MTKKKPPSKSSRTSSKTPAVSSDAELIAKAFAPLLLTWFEQNGRHDLPWQHPRTPYHVWLSEIMLQQTQVATVIPYFERFIQTFSCIESLAHADEELVLSLWAGLGYYARARNLHKAAKQLVQTYPGSFPDTPDEWQALPGVGQSTAAAIIAQSFNKRAPILDGNVKRVLSRICAFNKAIDAPEAQSLLWDLADRFTPSTQAANYTQAIMDLGATICTRSSPKCDECPVQHLCQAFAAQQVARYPIKRPKKEKPIKQAVFSLYFCDEHVWLEKRPAKGIWGSLWCLPEQQAWPEQADLFLANRHTFTHYHLDYRVALITIQNIDRCPCPLGEWVPWDRIFTLGLPAPIKRCLEQLEKTNA